MAKYKITSIPQARYGGVFNRTTKIMKGRRSNESSTDQEQPMVEVQNVAQPSYWNEMQSPVMTGKQCPPGKYDYNGQCLTESEMRAAWAEEQKVFEKQMSDRKLAHEQKMQESRQSLYDTLVKQEVAFRQRKYEDYSNTFKNSKKTDKIEPFDREPLTELSKEREEKLKQAGFLINKNKETGFAELYPIEFAYDRIINNGFFNNEFEKYWGLDPKQVKEQLGPLMNAANEQYDASLKNEIIDKAIKEGKSVAEVIKSLPASRGTKEGLKSFEKPATELVDKALDYIVNSFTEANQTDGSKISRDQDVFFSNDPIAAWENKYHNNDLKYYYDKSNRGGKAFNEQLNKSKVNPDIQYNRYDDQMAQQRDINRRSLQNFILPQAIQAGQNAENADFMNAFANFQNNITAPVINEVFKKAVNALSDGEKTRFISDIQVAPQLTMQRLLNKSTNKSGETYNDLLQKKSQPYMNAAIIHSGQQIKQGTGINENTTGFKVRDVLANPFDAAYFAMNPREEMWGNSNQSYETRKDIAKKFGVDTGLMPKDNPLAIVRDYTMLQALNPFKIGTNLRKGYDKGEFLNALGDELVDIGTKRGMMKGFNALGQLTKAARAANVLKYAPKFLPNIRKGTGALLSGFNNPFMNAGLLVESPENFSNAYDDLKAGNYGSAAWNGFLGVSGVAPAISAVRNLSKYGQTPTKAFNLGVTTPSGKYYGFKQIETPSKDLTYAINNQVLAEDLGVGLNNQQGYKSMMKQFHPDVSLYPQKIATDATANLGSLRAVPNTTTMVPGFNRTYPKNINTGEIGIVESPMFNLGRNYKLNVGSNIFKPQTLEEILLRPRPELYNFFPSTKNNSSFNTQTLFKQNGGALPKANLGQIVKAGKNLGRIANIGTVGTANTLAKNIAPVMINPARIPMFGATIEKMGPFTGSPLNALPFYGEKMDPMNGTAFRKFGDTLDYVKMSGELNPAAGPLLRMGKKQIMSEGNWAEPYEPNEQYSGVFGAQFNRNVPGSDLGFEIMSNRNGVLVTDALGNRKPSIPLSEPGLSFHRRLPFSNRYIPVNMDKLRNDEFDWRTQGGNLQSLIERYGYGAAYAAALAGMGMAAPQEYLNEYITEPVKKVYGKAEELLTNPWIKQKGGMVMKLSKKEIDQYIKDGYIIEDE